MTPTPVRPPAVAGSFYPAEPVRLRAQVERMLVEARVCGR
jgi:AmmeMemoRadiSam system protein B